MEAVTKTLRQLLIASWPTVQSNIPYVLIEPIKAWWHGDRAVISMNELPAIAIDGESESIDWSSFQTQEREYKIDVLCYCRGDDADLSTKIIYEMARLVERAWRQHVHWWVFERCYFDMEYMYDPQYLIDLNADVTSPFYEVLDPWIADISSSFASEWADAHQAYGGGTAPPCPSIRTEELYAAAYLKLYNEIDDALLDTSPWDTVISFTDEIGNAMSSSVGNIIRAYREDEIVPVRFIGDSRITAGSFGYVSNKGGASLLRACEINIYAKEQELVPSFGPL